LRRSPATRPLLPAATSGPAPVSVTTHPADRPLRALGFMLLAAGAFALMNTLARGLRAIPWPVLAFARGALGFVAALVVARWRGASLGIRDGRLMWRRSLFGSTGMVCTFFALTHMPLSDATALLNTTPLWIALLAWWTLGERPTRAVLVALAVAVAGVAMIERPSFAAGHWVGLVALGAGAAGAVAMVSLRRLSGETPEAVVVHFSAVASGVMAALSAVWLWQHGWPAGLQPSMLLGCARDGRRGDGGPARHDPGLRARPGRAGGRRRVDAGGVCPRPRRGGVCAGARGPRTLGHHDAPRRGHAAGVGRTTGAPPRRVMRVSTLPGERHSPACVVGCRYVTHPLAAFGVTLGRRSKREAMA
jgi:drug/metabolite transporter (DMT)-like permease